jgi:hypothetical protein
MAQKMVTPLATSLLHFQLNKLFKNMVCILALFGLATVLATFQKNIGQFFSKSSGHPVRGAGFRICFDRDNFSDKSLTDFINI